MRVLVRHRAEHDLVEAALQIESLRGGSGAYFLASVAAAIAHLQRFPRLAPIFREEFRRLLVPRSRYAIYYWLDGETAVVVAVLHLSSGKRQIKRALDRESI